MRTTITITDANYNNIEQLNKDFNLKIDEICDMLHLDNTVNDFTFSNN